VSVGALGATLEVDIQRELASNRPFVENVGPALGRLLAPHAEDPAITWIADVGGSITERAQICTHLLRRLNERRDAHPCGLVLVCQPARLGAGRQKLVDL